jgi:hypothetical protein
MKKYSARLTILAGLAAGILAGCSLFGQNQQAQGVPLEMTAVAESVESLRQEITSLAPTITALTNVMAAIHTAQALPTQTLAPTPTITLTQQPLITPSPQAPTQVIPPTQTALPLQDRLGPLPTPFEPGAVILQDDFSSQLGWFEDETPRFTLEYADGGYRIFVMTKNNPIWSTRAKGIGDVVLEADAQQTDGPIDSYYGLVCRFVDGKNYYMLVVSEDGTSRIVKVKTGKLTVLAQTSFKTSAFTPGEVNRLRADCISQNGVTTLTLYINDQHVLAAQDGEYQAGGLGFVAGNTTTSGVEVLFDNLLAIAPAP